MIPEKIEKYAFRKEKYAYPGNHPDCMVPEGYVEYEWLIDQLIQDVFEKLDQE